MATQPIHGIICESASLLEVVERAGAVAKWTRRAVADIRRHAAQIASTPALAEMPHGEHHA